MEAVAFMQSGERVDFTQNTALQAVWLAYDLKIPMADSIILAPAREWDAVLWTQDAEFEGIEESNITLKSD